MVISDYYNSLDRKSKGRFKRFVCSIIEIGDSTFNQKMKNNSFKMVEAEAIINYIKSKSQDNDRQN